MQARVEAEAADELAEKAWKAREDGIELLRAQIRDLEQRIEALREERPAFDARDAARKAFDRWRALKDAKVAAAEAKFPDLAWHARWSAAAWSPDEETLKAMGAARADVHAS